MMCALSVVRHHPRQSSRIAKWNMHRLLTARADKGRSSWWTRVPPTPPALFPGESPDVDQMASLGVFTHC
eukprot:scaffold16444_cov29-Tisochrysis_lutea.AAC.10